MACVMAVIPRDITSMLQLVHFVIGGIRLLVGSGTGLFGLLLSEVRSLFGCGCFLLRCSWCSSISKLELCGCGCQQTTTTLFLIEGAGSCLLSCPLLRNRIFLHGILLFLDFVEVLTLLPWVAIRSWFQLSILHLS